MSRIDAMLRTFEHEAATTRRALQAVPEEHLGWKPHPKSFTLGRLAGHIAELPAFGASILGTGDFEVTSDEAAAIGPLDPATHAELMEGFESRFAAFRRAAAAGVSDDHLATTWRMLRGDKVLLELSRGAALGGFVLRHLVHHRGQLSVYLRLLDLPVPSIYGPTADHPAFG